jgi:hypothetical protein
VQAQVLERVPGLARQALPVQSVAPVQVLGWRSAQVRVPGLLPVLGVGELELRADQEPQTVLSHRAQTEAVVAS